MKENVTMDELISLCRRRGFIFQSGEIYGGLPGAYDFGPLGVELKNNLKAAWWKSMVYERDDIEGIDGSILTHKLVLKHSGHEDTFTDPLVDCKKCHARMRADKLKVAGTCDFCGSTDLTEPRSFNLMFKTHMGAIEEDPTSFCYLRPETAQSIFTNFKNIIDCTSRKLPFGIAQIGKVFRNEITPRNFIFRVREFEQMELEYFIDPDSDDLAEHAKWVEARKQWWIKQGIAEEHLSFEKHAQNDLAHYSRATTDILYKYPHGFDELEGISDRTDFDLGSHTKEQKSLKLHSKVIENNDSIAKLAVQDIETKEFKVPYVIEPSVGVDRGILALICEAYTEETLENGSTRIVLKFKKHLAPIKVAVIPLAKNNEQIVAKCHEIKNVLQSLGIGRIKYEDTGNVGKAYRRNDEVGTPLCITVDFETFEKDVESVTVRDRDTMQQERINISDLKQYILNYFNN